MERTDVVGGAEVGEDASFTDELAPTQMTRCGYPPHDTPAARHCYTHRVSNRLISEKDQDFKIKIKIMVISAQRGRGRGKRESASFME